jgi:hypothetical protein
MPSPGSPSSHPDARRDYNLRKNYGISSADYDRMLEGQDGRCAICRSDQPGGRTKYFHVDHCHSTNKVRGLLCMPCNIMLGQADDNIDTLNNAINYLNSVRD